MARPARQGSARPCHVSYGRATKYPDEREQDCRLTHDRPAREEATGATKMTVPIGGGGGFGGLGGIPSLPSLGEGRGGGSRGCLAPILPSLGSGSGGGSPSVSETIRLCNETFLRDVITTDWWKERSVKFELHEKPHSDLGEHLQFTTWLPKVKKSDRSFRFPSPFDSKDD